ncbi:hypothetical protein ERJ75_001765700 [Trypanosoma vivax]|uniref:Uncharacterized protein n=1 Tax=Trypanosoma vivax (strain Y486) TaxID=1055687 RepID=G0TRI6_TRYVY|nr:hypothetical protein TRVL_02506 [Trypanosoma vivax]KAH8603995.1 hypothetical protein ERJ75_001765700 [Trypanosoma vivax]CCC46551.1 conserved hypothetical protein [Trypanosoma vivax Y486]
MQCGRELPLPRKAVALGPALGTSTGQYGSEGFDGMGTLTHAWWRCKSCVEHNLPSVRTLVPVVKLLPCGTSNRGGSKLNCSTDGGAYNDTARDRIGNAKDDKGQKRFWATDDQQHIYNCPGDSYQMPSTTQPASEVAWYQLAFETDNSAALDQPYNIPENGVGNRLSMSKVAGTVAMTAGVVGGTVERCTTSASVCQEQSKTFGLDSDPSTPPLFTPRAVSLDGGDRQIDGRSGQQLPEGGRADIFSETVMDVTEKRCTGGTGASDIAGEADPSTPPPLPPSPALADVAADVLNQIPSPRFSAPPSDASRGITLERLMRAVRSARELARQQQQQTK